MRSSGRAWMNFASVSLAASSLVIGLPSAEKSAVDMLALRSITTSIATPLVAIRVCPATVCGLASAKGEAEDRQSFQEARQEPRDAGLALRNISKPVERRPGQARTFPVGRPQERDQHDRGQASRLG